GKPVLVPVADLADGATFGASSLDKEGKALVLRWLLLGGAKEKAKGYKVSLDDWTGAAKPGETEIKVPLALENGKTHRWKLELELASGETAGFDWQKITADLVAPA